MITIGIDEVGRGCWAGPLVAGAVALSGSIQGLKDSKVLSKTQRERLDTEIRSSALLYGLGLATVDEIDNLGLTKATTLAMSRALQQLAHSLTKEEPVDIVIDGNINYLKNHPGSRCLVGGDKLLPSISAASIIAKVYRDTYMAVKAHKNYPYYGFDRHVGYGTVAHRRALEVYGICELHRRSFKPVALITRVDSSS